MCVQYQQMFTINANGFSNVNECLQCKQVFRNQWMFTTSMKGECFQF